jgi:hypothetical protein
MYVQPHRTPHDTNFNVNVVWIPLAPSVVLVKLYIKWFSCEEEYL